MNNSDRELCFLSIQDASRLIHSKEISPVALTEAYLRRIEAVDDKLGSYLTLLSDEALEESRLAEQAIANGNSRGPLHGIPMGHKDLYDTKGVLTTGSSLLFRDRIPDQDATVIAKLRDAGSVLLGKHQMSEFAMGFPASLGPIPRNPWNTEHSPGGSSSGTGAAVAAGLCAGGLGSDTGGSIRGPASLNGIVGMIPTYGRASRAGVLPLSWSLDHAGPLTRTVEDAALMLQAISGHDPRDPTSSNLEVPDFSSGLHEGIKGIKIGVPRQYIAAANSEISSETIKSVDKAIKELEGLGAHVEEVEIPGLEHLRILGSIIFMSEAFTYYQHFLRTRGEEFGKAFRNYVYAGALFSAADYVQAQRARADLKRKVARIFQHVDVLALPTHNGPAPKLDLEAPLDPRRFIRGAWLTMIFNMTSCPAISLPCGYSEGGLPIGLQIAAKPFDEITALRVAYNYQEHAGLKDNHPPI